MNLARFIHTWGFMEFIKKRNYVKGSPRIVEAGVDGDLLRRFKKHFRSSHLSLQSFWRGCWNCTQRRGFVSVSRNLTEPSFSSSVLQALKQIQKSSISLCLYTSFNYTYIHALNA